MIISDLHSGSVWGLSSPEFYYRNTKVNDEWTEHRKQRRKMQEEAWTEYLRIVKQWYKPDVLLVNGDAIEGRQSRQGSSELITANLEEQARMAVICISQFKAKKILMTYGTSCHNSPEAEDWEHIIAQDLKADISGHIS